MMMNITSLRLFLFLWASPLWSGEKTDFTRWRYPANVRSGQIGSPVVYSQPTTQQPLPSPTRSNSNTLSRSSLVESVQDVPLPSPTLPKAPARRSIPQKNDARLRTLTSVGRSTPVDPISSPEYQQMTEMLPLPSPISGVVHLPIALGGISFTALQLMKILAEGGAFQVVPDKGIRSVFDTQAPIPGISKRVIWVKEEGLQNGYWLDGRSSLLQELQEYERNKRLGQISWHPEHEDVREARVYINDMPTRWHICLLSTESQYRRWSRMTQLKKWAAEYMNQNASPVFFPHPTKMQYMILAKGPFECGLDWQFFKIWSDQATTESSNSLKLARQLQSRLVFMKEEPHRALPGPLACLDDPPRRWNAYFIAMKAKNWAEEKEFCATYEPWKALSYFRKRKYQRWITAAVDQAPQ